jgi:hypothetical protein
MNHRPQVDLAPFNTTTFIVTELRGSFPDLTADLTAADFARASHFTSNLAVAGGAIYVSRRVVGVGVRGTRAVRLPCVSCAPFKSWDLSVPSRTCVPAERWCKPVHGADLPAVRRDQHAIHPEQGFDWWAWPLHHHNLGLCWPGFGLWGLGS